MIRTIIIILLCIGSNIILGQEVKVKHTLFDFKMKSNYEVEKKDTTSITLLASSTIEGLPIVNRIEIKKSRINPEKNKIKKISDFANLEMISVVGDFFENRIIISGVSEIGKKEVFYTLLKTEYFKDSSKTKLIGYNFQNNNFILENGIIYSVNFSSKLIINDLTSFDASNFKILDKIKTNQIMTSHINSGDLNSIIETLKIKKQ